MFEYAREAVNAVLRGKTAIEQAEIALRTISWRIVTKNDQQRKGLERNHTDRQHIREQARGSNGST